MVLLAIAAVRRQCIAWCEWVRLEGTVRFEEIWGDGQYAPAKGHLEEYAWTKCVGLKEVRREVDHAPDNALRKSFSVVVSLAGRILANLYVPRLYRGGIE